MNNPGIPDLRGLVLPAGIPNGSEELVLSEKHKVPILRLNINNADAGNPGLVEDRLAEVGFPILPDDYYRCVTYPPQDIEVIISKIPKFGFDRPMFDKDGLRWVPGKYGLESIFTRVLPKEIEHRYMEIYESGISLNALSQRKDDFVSLLLEYDMTHLRDYADQPLQIPSQRRLEDYLKIISIEEKDYGRGPQILKDALRKVAVIKWIPKSA